MAPRLSPQPTVTLVFTTSSSLLARAIRRVTNSPVSHVAISLPLAGVPVMLHADVGGVQIVPASRFFYGRTLVEEYALTPGTHYNIERAIEDIGERYDYFGLLGHLARLTFVRFGIRLRRPLTSSHATVCSEFVARLGLPSFANLDPERTSPGELLLVCRSAPELVKVKWSR